MKNDIQAFTLYSLLASSLLLTTGCDDDDPYLATYPDNHPSAMIISDAKGASEKTIQAFYRNDGTLALNETASREYTLRLDIPSPEDVTVHFEVSTEGIPQECLEVSGLSATIPAGFTDGTISVGLKNEDMEFARSEYGAKDYEIKVKMVSIEGYKMQIPEQELVARFCIHKEAYAVSCFIPAGEQISFDRVVVGGKVMNEEEMKHTFSVQLNKPARNDVKITFTTEGLENADCIELPQEVIIPAGQTSAEVICIIKDDFLLESSNSEDYFFFSLIASMTTDDATVTMDENQKKLEFLVNKTSKLIKFVYSQPDSWTELTDKGNWKVTLSDDATGNAEWLTDGDIDDRNNYVSDPGSLQIAVDLGSTMKLAGLGVDCRGQYELYECLVEISDDGTNWTNVGKADGYVQHQYFQFTIPVETRYFRLTDVCDWAWNKPRIVEVRAYQ